MSLKIKKNETSPVSRPLMREGMRLMVNLARQQVALLPPCLVHHPSIIGTR
jgi:hypothetical protein